MARTAVAAKDDVPRGRSPEAEAFEHVTVRLPRSLLDAAKRESRRKTDAEVIQHALEVLAEPDSFKRYFKASTGILGPNHTLDVF